MLAPHALTSAAQMFGMEMHEAPESAVTITRKFQITTFEPTAAAYAVVREIYLWFGVNDDKIPYITDSHVDTSAIVNT